MDICRICLSINPNKDICELQAKNGNQSYLEIMRFCLDIQVAQDSKVTTKLCLKCYKKILTFYKFKCLAIKNDAHLKSVEGDTDVKSKIFIGDDIKTEDVSRSSSVVKEELCHEDNVYHSDDELLSVLKKIKYEYVTEETKENAPVKNKRGRPKKLKTDNVKGKADKKPVQVCEECGKSVMNLKEHSLRHRPVGERKKVQCKECGKIFTSSSAMRSHAKRKHLGIKKYCKVCNKFVVHLKQHHLSVHDRDAMPFECVSCGRRFISRSALNLHMTLHTKERPFSCDLCENKFRTNIAMMLHRRQVHDKEKSHLCQFCSKSFFKKYHLQVHLRSHTKEKPYKCPDCDKVFSTTSILKNHRLIHSEVKMFSCTQCDMTFMRSGYLRAHMISHTKEKRYQCQYCGVKFHRSDHRKRHERTSHERHQTFP